MTRVSDVLLRSAGGLLAAGACTIGAVRHGVKPLHPRGDLVAGRVVRDGGTTTSGVAWLDEPGTDEVVVRVSRAIGLPDRLPDVYGLAIRVPFPTGPADLLLASTGHGRLSRYLLTAARRIQDRPLTSLLPSRSPVGPLLLGAEPDSGDCFELRWAIGSGTWVPFGRLELLESTGPDPALSFDPVLHPVPGLPPYRWVQLLREPAYRSARSQSDRRA